MSRVRSDKFGNLFADDGSAQPQNSWASQRQRNSPRKSLLPTSHSNVKWCGRKRISQRSLRTLSKSAKSESSSQRLRMMCWNSASFEGLQSPLPSIIVALKAAIKRRKSVSLRRGREHSIEPYPCSRSLSGRGSHCYRYLVKGKRESDEHIFHVLLLGQKRTLKMPFKLWQRMTMMGGKYFEWGTLRSEMNNSAQWISPLYHSSHQLFTISLSLDVYQVTCNTERNAAQRQRQ